MKRVLMVLLVLSFVACSNNKERIGLDEKEVIWNEGEFYKDKLIYSIEDNKPVTGRVIEEYYGESLVMEVEVGRVVGEKLLYNGELITSYGLINNRHIHGHYIGKDYGFRVEADMYYGIPHGSVIKRDGGEVDEFRYHYGMLHGVYKSGDTTEYYNKGALVLHEEDIEDLIEYDLSKSKDIKGFVWDEENRLVLVGSEKANGLYSRYMDKGYEFLYVEDGIAQEHYLYMEVKDDISDRYIYRLVGRRERSKGNDGSLMNYYHAGRTHETIYLYDDGREEIKSVYEF